MKVNSVTGRAAVACVVAAVLVLAALGLTGFFEEGVAVALGLVLGSVNGLWAERTIGDGTRFRVSSLGRLGVLTLLAIGAGLVLGIDHVWLVIIGVAAAQAVLVAVAARSLLSK